MAYLESRTKMSTTAVILESIERYYAATLSEEAATPYEILTEAGFVGCADGPANLSSSYKQDLGRSLGKKT